MLVYARLCNEALDCVTANSAEEQCSVRNVVGEILSSDVHTHTLALPQQSTVGRGNPNKRAEFKNLIYLHYNQKTVSREA